MRADLLGRALWSPFALGILEVVGEFFVSTEIAGPPAASVFFFDAIVDVGELRIAITKSCNEQCNASPFLRELLVTHANTHVRVMLNCEKGSVFNFAPIPPTETMVATVASPDDTYVFSGGSLEPTKRRIQMTIRNPVEWSADQVSLTAHALKAVSSAFVRPDLDLNAPVLEVRRINLADIKAVLISGLCDFMAYRTDLIFICFIYPLIGIVLTNITVSLDVLPLLFPLISGFALIGPFAAAGLYEMSRRQEQGKRVSWIDAFGVFGSPAFAAIAKLGLILIGIFLLWLATAMLIYRLTLGPAMPSSLGPFIRDVFTTTAGQTLIAVGVGVGFLFALLVFAISVVSFPLLLDRRVRISTAVRTSVRAVVRNPIPMLAWGLILASGLVLGAIPALVGLIFVMPVLGHATWHLYRKVVR